MIMPPTHDTHDDDQERLDQRRQRVDRRLDLLVVEVGDLVEHLVERTGLLTDRHHLHDHRREHRVLLEPLRERLAPLHRGLRVAHGLGHDLVARRLGDDVERLEDRHTGAHQRRQRAARSGRAPSCATSLPKTGTFSLIASQRLRPSSELIHFRNAEHAADLDRRRRRTRTCARRSRC